MKRLWAAAAFAVFIAISIGTYYVQASISRLPQFKLVKLDGDEAEATPLVISAQYFQLPYQEILSISTKDSKYQSESSLLERIQGTSPYPALTREYSNFMRGNPYAAQYLNDDDFLVRAEMETVRTNSRDGIFRLHVAVLDKKTNRTHRMVTTMPVDGPKYNWMRTTDVQRAGSHLKIAVQTNSATPDAASKEEQHIYDLNISDGQITADQNISFKPFQRPGKMLHTSNVYDADSTQPDKYLLLYVTVNGIPRDNGAAGGRETAVAENTVEQEYLMIYHYDTGTMDFLSWPESKPEAGLVNEIYQDGEYVLWTKMNGNEVKLKRYRLADNQLENELQLKKEDFQAESISHMQFGKNRLYLLLKTGEKPRVAALDTRDGRIVYRGEIAAKDSNGSGKQQLRNLEVHGFIVMQ
ncbi:MAG: hypothetical protein JWR03_1952 [Cohnella sp.]|nr:hypothetical protein [Cohnella sp.]